MECDANPPSQVGSVAQGGSNNQPGWWRNSSRADSNKVRSLKIALNSLSPEESGARVDLQAALRRAKEVTQKPVQRSSTTPDVRAAEARVKVAKLEKALEEGTDGVEVDAIKKALVKAKVPAHEKPVSEQIADCKSFIDWAEKRLVKLDAERESEHALIEEGRARFARLEANVAASVPLPPSVPVAAMEAELVRLRAELADARTPVPQLPNCLREDFVPNTVEEAALWMRCRQQDMEDAIAQGSEGDVSRLAHVIAEGAIQLRQWTQPPSSVVNMVS